MTPSSRINVTKSFLPPVEEFKKYVDAIWSSGQLTNNGPLSKEFEVKAANYLKVKNFKLVSNGTLALQLAIRALNLKQGEIVTTPFSYVATTSSILWENFTPVFADINPQTLTIDPKKIEAAITENTRAIMPVHVFGIACDTEAIKALSKKYHIPVIYDGAHAFGVTYRGKSLASYGDISTCSFHATKLFHTIEGGAVIVNKRPSLIHKIELMKRFGHNGDEHTMLGINAKATEFQAAMGLCNLNYIDGIISRLKYTSCLYDKFLAGSLDRPVLRDKQNYNFAYYPVIFQNSKQREKALSRLASENIFPRKYFSPSLNTLNYLQKNVHCPVSEDMSSRILCLPMYSELKKEDVKRIVDRIL